MPEAVLIPLLNPNEPEAQLAALHVSEGQRVTKGELLCTLETTKSAADLAAESEGFVAGLRAAVGDTLRAGEVLCYLAPDPDWQPPAPAAASPAGPAAPQGLRITQPALRLAQERGLDLNSLPQDRLLTERLLRAMLDEASSGSSPAAPFDSLAIVIYGGGGHAKALIDLLRALNVYRIAGVLDDNLSAGANLMGVPVLGGSEALDGLYAQGVRLAVNAVGGISSLAIRIKVFDRLAAAGFACPALVHPRAFVEPSARLAAGVQVFPHAYIGSEAQAGYGCIINSGAIVSHDCSLGEYSNLSPGAILAGEVQVGAGVLVGMGATINLRVRVGAGARIGNSAVVKEDVPEKGIVRAGTGWPE